MKTSSGIALILTSSSLFCACGGDIGGVATADAAGSVDGDSEVITPVCDPPDFMVVLDRTGSMSQKPDGAMPPNTTDGADLTKWSIAVSTLESLTAAYETSMRFGLALFPRDPDGAGGTDCSNLDTWLTEYLPPESNDPVCEPAEVLVSPGLNTAAAIDGAIDRDGTGLCSYTPIGAGLESAREALQAVAQPEREQYALLITDGADTCDFRTEYTSKSLAAADALAADGVEIFVIGFDGSGAGIDEEHLNHLACAGRTAPSFGTNCVLSGSSYRAIDNPSPSRLFLLAEDATSLGQQLVDISSEICCGCID